MGPAHPWWWETVAESFLLCKLRGQNRKGSQSLPSSDPSLWTAEHCLPSTRLRLRLPAHHCPATLPGLKAQCVSCTTVNVLSACSPVGGKRRGGLVMNEYWAKTTGLRLQREVTMVTKAKRRRVGSKSPPRSSLSFQKSASLPALGSPHTRSSAALSASRSSEQSEDDT